MAQTLARHSDIRLTLGVYTHVELPDRSVAIESLPAPSVGRGLDREEIGYMSSVFRGTEVQQPRTQARGVSASLKMRLGTTLAGLYQLGLRCSLTSRPDRRKRQQHDANLHARNARERSVNPTPKRGESQRRR